MLDGKTEEKYINALLSRKEKISYYSSCAEHRRAVIELLGNKCSICNHTRYFTRKNKVFSRLQVHAIPDNSWCANKRDYYKYVRHLSPSAIKHEAYLLCRGKCI